ncbi:hypothetical protein DL93DRAFT_403879 [Clavulina sp. PMI_390]|nr:hypothetical protein DL93DRAFT_403879 [Clavulina sp. PMI_390]
MEDWYHLTVSYHHHNSSYDPNALVMEGSSYPQLASQQSPLSPHDGSSIQHFTRPQPRSASGTANLISEPPLANPLLEQYSTAVQYSIDGQQPASARSVTQGQTSQDEPFPPGEGSPQYYTTSQPRAFLFPYDPSSSLGAADSIEHPSSSSFIAQYPPDREDRQDRTAVSRQRCRRSNRGLVSRPSSSQESSGTSKGPSGSRVGKVHSLKSCWECRRIKKACDLGLDGRGWCKRCIRRGVNCPGGYVSKSDLIFMYAVSDRRMTSAMTPGEKTAYRKEWSTSPRPNVE